MLKYGHIACQCHHVAAAATGAGHQWIGAGQRSWWRRWLRWRLDESGERERRGAHLRREAWRLAAHAQQLARHLLLVGDEHCGRRRQRRRGRVVADKLVVVVR